MQMFMQIRLLFLGPHLLKILLDNADRAEHCSVVCDPFVGPSRLFDPCNWFLFIFKYYMVWHFFHHRFVAGTKNCKMEKRKSYASGQWLPEIYTYVLVVFDRFLPCDWLWWQNAELIVAFSFRFLLSSYQILSQLPCFLDLLISQNNSWNSKWKAIKAWHILAAKHCLEQERTRVSVSIDQIKMTCICARMRKIKY